jgi:hypothetical protein
MVKPQPWIPADATDEIRAIAKRDDFGLVLTMHAREQMADRSLIASDVLFVLKQGFVLNQAQESTGPDFHKYAIESRSPNSGSRTVRVFCIPDPGRLQIKVVTVMWVD